MSRRYDNRNGTRRNAPNSDTQRLSRREVCPWVLAERKSGTATLTRLQYDFADLLERPMQEISPWVIEKWRAEQLKRGKQKNTVNRDITGLKSVLAKAVAWESCPVTLSPS